MFDPLNTCYTDVWRPLKYGPISLALELNTPTSNHCVIVHTIAQLLIMSEGMTGASGGGDEDQSFSEFQDYLQLHAKNGVILNGLLTWIDIQQKTTAPLVWRNLANLQFSEPEVMEAKEAL